MKLHSVTQRLSPSFTDRTDTEHIVSSGHPGVGGGHPGVGGCHPGVGGGHSGVGQSMLAVCSPKRIDTFHKASFECRN